MNAASAAAANPPSGRGAIFGHPRGLAYLAFTELWERFSYYGMTALLALYMVKQLLLPGHAEHVLGLAGLRHLFEFRGPMSDLAFASLIYGWYAGLVYFTPILGGLVADRWLGAKRTVVIGALLMSAGHLAMSFDASFLMALALLILGSGCLKGNISAQVGTLYPRAGIASRARLHHLLDRDQHRRGDRPAGDRVGGGAVRLARGLRTCRRADVAGAGRLPRRSAAFARAAIAPPREKSAPDTGRERAAPGADRGHRLGHTGQHCLPHDLEHRHHLGRRRGAARNRVGHGPRRLVQFARQLRQHPGRRTAGCPVGCAGAPRPNRPA